MMKRIVAFGDSITYGNGSSDKSGYIPLLEQKLLKQKLPNLKVINRGMCVESTDWALQRIARVIEEENPSFILIMEGLNDILLHKQEDPIKNLREIIQICKQKNIVPLISTILPIKPRFSLKGRILLSLSNVINKKKPTKIWPNERYDKLIIKTNKRIKALAEEESILCLDAFEHFQDLNLSEVLNDTVHPNDKGYQILAELWHQALLTIMEK